MRALLLLAAARCAAAVPVLIQTFLGAAGTCAAPTGPARLYAGVAPLATSQPNPQPVPWSVSAPAPLEFERALFCQWCRRPAVDTAARRVWHVSGACGSSAGTRVRNGTRVVVEWALSAPPTYTGACAFDAPFAPAPSRDPAYGVYDGFAALPLLAFDARVHAAGPYVINATDGAAVVGLTVPPDPAGTVTSLGALPPCGAEVLARLPPGTDVHNGVLTAEDVSGTASPPQVVHLHGNNNTASASVVVVGLSPVSGAQLWRANVTVPLHPSPWTAFREWEAAEVHAGTLIATATAQSDRLPSCGMLRGDGLSAGGNATLTWLTNVQPVENGPPFGTYGTCLPAAGGAWPLHTLVASTWRSTDGSTYCCEAATYPGDASSQLLSLPSAAGDPTTFAWGTFPSCLLPPPSACDHPAAALWCPPDSESEAFRL